MPQEASVLFRENCSPPVTEISLSTTVMLKFQGIDSITNEH